jgi:hypothetical protein
MSGESEGQQEQREQQVAEAPEQTGVALIDEVADSTIRHVWHDGRWFFSVIDVIGVLTGTERPRKYWNDLKVKLASEGYSELSAKIGQLKMTASDGKQRLTDAADTEALLRLSQSIPSPRVDPLKQWLARVGAERLDEMENPELAADRMRMTYRRQGYSDEWIEKRLQSIVMRDELTSEWRERGAQEGRGLAPLTDILNHGTFDVSVAEHKAVKGLKSQHNLRDSMTALELVLTSLAEATATAIHQAHDSDGLVVMRRDIEARTNQPVVSVENFKSLREARCQQPLQLWSGASQDEAGGEG